MREYKNKFDLEILSFKDSALILCPIAVFDAAKRFTKKFKCKALIDTGAEITFISQKLINKLKLNIESDLISETTLDIINGDKIKCQTVPLGIEIPYQSSNFEIGKYATREMSESEYSVIIGMDILRGFELTWNGHQGKAWLRY